MKRAPLFFMLCLAASSASALVGSINLKNAEKYYMLGLQLESRKDWSGAREAYSRALVNERSGGAPAALVSATLFNLGRMIGYTCDFPSAEESLQESLKTERALPNPGEANVTKRLSELARLTFDMGKFGDSVAYYREAVPSLEQLGVASKDPIGFATYLDAFAASLEASGEGADAAKVRERAAKLRSDNPGKSAGFVPVEYRDVCRK